MTIQLSVWREGKLIQRGEGARDHVLRQVPLEMGAQFGNAWILSRNWYDIGDQAFVAGLIFANYDGGSLQGRMFAEDSFDFTQLDAIAA